MDHFCLPIHPSVDTWVASTFWPLRTMPLSTQVYKYLFKSVISISWATHPELGHMVSFCLIFEASPDHFPQQVQSP